MFMLVVRRLCVPFVFVCVRSQYAYVQQSLKVSSDDWNTICLHYVAFGFPSTEHHWVLHAEANILFFSDSVIKSIVFDSMRLIHTHTNIDSRKCSKQNSLRFKFRFFFLVSTFNYPRNLNECNETIPCFFFLCFGFPAANCFQWQRCLILILMVIVLWCWFDVCVFDLFADRGEKERVRDEER